MRSRLGAALVVMACTALSGCSRADEKAADTGSTTLTVYVSLPFQGAAGPDAQATADGARLALREAGGKAGEFVVKLVVADDSRSKDERWNAEQTADNARVAARDRTAIAYLGDGPSGATAISLPILNAAGVPQVSPTSAYQGFTTAQDAAAGEPARFFPSGVRTFARPVPSDDVQARALVEAMRDQDCRRLQLLQDRDAAVPGLGRAVQAEAARAGIAVEDRDELAPGFDPVREAAAVAARDADCVLFSGALAREVPSLFTALHAAAPRLELFGGDELASGAFAAGLDAGTQARTHLTAPPGVLEPGTAVRRFSQRFRAAFGTAPRTGSVYGYEAMRLVLGAMRAAGPEGNDRTAVARELRAGRPQAGVLGPYRITRDGDTDRTDYSRLAVRGGRLVLVRTAAYPRG